MTRPADASRRVLRTVVSVLIGGALLASGCSGDDLADAAPPIQTVPVDTTGGSTTEPNATTAPAESVSVTVVAVAAAVVAERPDARVSDCVELVPIGAALGESRTTALWAAAAEDVAALPALCTQLLATDPAAIAAMSDQLAAYKAAHTTVPAPVPPAPEPPIPEPLTPVACPVAGSAVLRRGDGLPDACDAVRELQTLLVAAGHAIAVDGHFGPATEQAVRGFQEANGFVVDGLVGPATWAALHGGQG